MYKEMKVIHYYAYESILGWEVTNSVFKKTKWGSAFYGQK